MCFKDSCSTQRFHNSCAPELVTQHKHQICMCSRASRSTQTFKILMHSRASRSTQTLNTHVLQIFSLNTNIKYSCAPEVLTQHKHQILMCFRAHAQQKHLINYVLQGPRPTHEIIYIKHMQLAYAQYIKQIIILMCSGVLCPIYIT